MTLIRSLLQTEAGCRNARPSHRKPQLRLDREVDRAAPVRVCGCGVAMPQEQEGHGRLEAFCLPQCAHSQERRLAHQHRRQPQLQRLVVGEHKDGVTASRGLQCSQKNTSHGSLSGFTFHSPMNTYHTTLCTFWFAFHFPFESSF